MDRTLAVGATSGSLSALLLRLLTESVARGLPPFECPICPDFTDLHWGEHPIDPFSLCVGLLIGLLLGPAIELLYLARQSWRIWVQNRLAHLTETKPATLYRLG